MQRKLHYVNLMVTMYPQKSNFFENFIFSSSNNLSQLLLKYLFQGKVITSEYSRKSDVKRVLPKVNFLSIDSLLALLFFLGMCFSTTGTAINS